MQTRKTVFDRLMESVARVAILPSADAGGTTIVSDAGGGGSAASPPATPAGGGDGGGSSGSPAPAPAATPPSSPSPDPAPTATPDASDPWAGLGLDPSEPDEISIPTQPAQPATPAPSQPAAPTPQAPPPQTPPVAPPPAPEPAAPAQQAPAQPSAASMPSPAEPAALAEFMLAPANRQAILDHIARDKYALSDQEIAELSEDAAVAVPKLLAKAHLEVTASTMRFIQQAIPAMIAQHTKVTDANKRAETQFFSAVKGLDANNKQHREAAGRIVALYRKMQPDASMEQVIQICAPMVLQAVGPSTGAPTNTGSPAAAVTPPAPTIVPAAFQPAIGAGGAQPAPAENNPWMGLGGSYDED